MKCPSCGGAVEADFRFCPRCGRPIDGAQLFEDLLDSSFSRISSNEAAVSVERLTELDKSLRELENELDELAESGQRLRAHRR